MVITKEKFIEKLNGLLNQKNIPSKTHRATYSSFKIEKKTITFKRDSTDQIWKINIDELYKAYANLKSIDNLTKLKPFVGYKTYSPSFAILMFIGLYNPDGSLAAY